MKRSKYVRLFVFALAIAFAIPALAQAPAQPSPAAQQASAHFTASDWPKSAAAYEALTKSEPKNGLAWFRLGWSLHELGQYEKALAAYDEANKLSFAPGPVQFRIARTYAKSGQTAKALEHLQLAANANFFNFQLLDSDPDLAALRNDPKFAPIRAHVYRTANPCDTPEHKQFDFWVGEWDVFTTGANQPAGKSLIERVIAPCAIQENWESLGVPYAGKSFNIFNAATKKWQQFWIDSTGRVTEYSGTWRDGALRFEAVQQNPNGTSSLMKMTFTPLPDGAVRQFGELSNDSGKTWSTAFDLTYRRKPAATPAGASK